MCSVSVNISIGCSVSENVTIGCFVFVNALTGNSVSSNVSSVYSIDLVLLTGCLVELTAEND